MNLMFCFPAAVASSIAACRSFVSLTNFRSKDVYVHAAAIHPPTRRHPSGGSGGSDVIQICASDNSLAKTSRSLGIAFRNTSACVDSVGQGYSLDRLESGTSDTPAAMNSKGGYGFGGADESGEVAVHAAMTIHGHSSVVDGPCDHEVGH